MYQTIHTVDPHRRSTMTFERTKPDFRYADDPAEVTLRLSAAQARLIAWALQDCPFEDSAIHDEADALGTELAALMEQSADSPADVITGDVRVPAKGAEA
jgi:hypothetical protein